MEIRNAGAAPKGVTSQPMLRSCLVCFTVLLSGCFTYVRTDEEVVPVGQDVRLLVTREGAADLTALTDAEDVGHTIQGTLVRREDDALFIGVPFPNRTGSSALSSDMHQTIRVPTGEILATDRRQWNAGRTGLLLGGAVTTGVLLFLEIIQVGRNTADNPGEDRDWHLALFSIQIG